VYISTFTLVILSQLFLSEFLFVYFICGVIHALKHYWR